MNVTQLQRVLFQFVSIFWLIGMFTVSMVHAKPQNAQLESKVKKIVMMMNIVNKEYHEGIQGGEVINAAEYEESPVFLQQAFERYGSIADKGTADGSKELKQKFSQLTQKIKSKNDPAEIKSMVSAINAGLTQEFDLKLSQTPTEPVSLENGRQLYLSNCKVCHGVAGQGDGPLADQLDPRPAVLADPQRTGDEFSKPFDNFQIINVGIANTAMMGWADQFSEKELWDLTYFIRTFSNTNVKLPIILATSAQAGEGGTGDSRVKQIFEEVDGLLAGSLSAYKKDETKLASEQAFDAYLTYEKVETPLITKRKDLGLRLESSFGRLQAEIKRKASVDLVTKITREIETDLDEAQSILTQEIGFTGLFIQSFSIIVREGFEAILIIAALITFLVRSKNRDKLRSIYWGVGLGILGSFITAYILHEILKVSMSSQELLEGWIMLVAVVVLFYVS